MSIDYKFKLEQQDGLPIGLDCRFFHDDESVVYGLSLKAFDERYHTTYECQSIGDIQKSIDKHIENWREARNVGTYAKGGEPGEWSEKSRIMVNNLLKGFNRGID